MSLITVTPVVFYRFSKDGKCIYCGSQHNECEVCKKWFIAGKSDNKICSSRCRTRKHRQRIRDELDLDDE